MDGVPLDHLLDGIDGVLVDRAAPIGPGAGASAPGGPGAGGSAPEITGVAILDPDDDSRGHHGELVLVIGPRGRESLPLARAAVRGGAAAVALKGSPDLAALGDVAGDLGVPLLVVRPGVRWDQVVMLLRERLDVAELGQRPGGPGPEGNDLFGLAEDIAVATGGVVSIEDAGNRVLAYSRSDNDNDVDELRRLSILGWRGPESYLRMLRDWGVFDQLRAGERVVRVEEHPEFGIRPRLAIGIRAGARYLGTIWVQRRTAPFAERAEQALVGAARLAAAEILRRRTGSELTRGSRHELLADLITGRVSTDLVAGRLGLDPESPALVIAFGAPVQPDVASRELQLEQALGLVSVYATAHHRHALVGLIDDRVYAVLPGGPAARMEPATRSWAGQAVEALRASGGAGVCAGIGLPAPALAMLSKARSEADRALEALLRPGNGGSARTVASIAELRAEVLLTETLELLAERPELTHPGVELLAEHDAERDGDLVGSVLAHLDSLGDVRTAAEALSVHPNTLRYRLRRARELSGIDLDDPRQRLACHLQLLLVSRRSGRARAR